MQKYETLENKKPLNWFANPITVLLFHFSGRKWFLSDAKIRNIFETSKFYTEKVIIYFFRKHLNTSLFCSESLCGRGFEKSEVFWELLTLLLTQLLTRILQFEVLSEVLGEVLGKHLTHANPFAVKGFGVKKWGVEYILKLEYLRRSTPVF